MAAILDFGYLQKSKHLNNVSGRFLIPQNIRLDTWLVLLVCMVRKLWSKYENGGHFGRHLGFWRMPTRDFRGLFISDSTHIPGPILKKSACYQKCPPFGALWPNTTGLYVYCAVSSFNCQWILLTFIDINQKPEVLDHLPYFLAWNTNEFVFCPWTKYLTNACVTCIFWEAGHYFEYGFKVAMCVLLLLKFVGRYGGILFVFIYVLVISSGTLHVSAIYVDDIVMQEVSSRPGISGL